MKQILDKTCSNSANAAQSILQRAVCAYSINKSLNNIHKTVNIRQQTVNGAHNIRIVRTVS